jgi:CAAX protease family protein
MGTTRSGDVQEDTTKVAEDIQCRRAPTRSVVVFAPMLHTPSLLTAVTYGALLFTVIGLWIGRYVWMGLLGIAVIAGYVSGVLQGLAIVGIALFAGVCVGYQHVRGQPPGGLGRRLALGLFAAAILLFGLLLGMHMLPGFNNFLVLDKVVLSNFAAPYTLYLNFDKTLVGVLILGLCHQPLLRGAKKWAEALRRTAPIVPLHIGLVAAGAAAIGYLTWQPKWTPIFLLWAPVNLFFVCLSEEAFFRGFIQRELDSALRGTRAGSAIAIAVSAGLFGLAHFGGGVSYIVLATAAGLGYAIIYHRTRSIEMSMLAHFALNTVHFLLFTYPAIA